MIYGEIQLLYVLLNFWSCLLNGKEVDLVLFKMGFNVVNLINIKEMLKLFYERMGVFFYEYFYR